MVTMTASIDGAASAALNTALQGFGRSLGEVSALTPKYAALSVCDSLRHNTKKAPKMARRSEYAADYSPNPPRYITYRRGAKLPKPIHRWSLTRKLGTPDEYTKDHFVYVHTKETKRGKIIKDKAAELRELKKYHLGIAHAGLAKIAWNKTKDEIKRGTSDVVWKKRKNDRRAPLNDVHGSFKKSGTVNVTGVAEIHNHLDYAEAALNPGAIDKSMGSAALKLIYNKAFKDLTSGGMSVEDACRHAKETADIFRAEFGL